MVWISGFVSLFSKYYLGNVLQQAPNLKLAICKENWWVHVHSVYMHSALCIVFSVTFIKKTAETLTFSKTDQILLQSELCHAIILDLLQTTHNFSFYITITYQFF